MNMRATREQLETSARQASAENTLLIQYVSDVENGVKPTASEHEGKGEERVEGKLYRPFAGHGGIAVIRFRAGDKWDVHVRCLEEYVQQMRADYSEHTVNLRIVLDRLVIARNRAYESKVA